MKLTQAIKANLVEVLTVKGRSITKQEMVDKYHTGNWQAARRLARAMKALKITTPAELKATHWEELTEEGAGFMTLLVATHVIAVHYDVEASNEWIMRKRRVKA